MATFATIDMNSGYIWWAGEADNALEACKLSDEEGGNDAREFAEISRSDRCNADYAVYAIPKTLNVTDGQDKEQIKAVESARFVGYFAEI